MGLGNAFGFLRANAVGDGQNSTAIAIKPRWTGTVFKLSLGTDSAASTDRDGRQKIETLKKVCLAVQLMLQGMPATQVKVVNDQLQQAVLMALRGR